MKDKFFSKIDWASFWTATLLTLVVYFYTLGPSVGLEDSGELATAGAHLGVPHPPGYPFWSLCSWLFCKLFGWVTYMGHPTPAWCISLFSAVAGAFAAGCTAMLICRSSRDFIDKPSATGDDIDGFSNAASILSFGGGVAGALTFALSPVEWSQSTIVEIYSLNALFLMGVFLLSYRWMRRPSDRILWVTAYVFGLGLTNYQVLVFAIVPLALIILMKNGGMFRDVFIYLVPVALTYQILQIGQLQQASQFMQRDVIAKHGALDVVAKCPNSALIIFALAVLVAALFVAGVLKGRDRRQLAVKVTLYGGGGAAALILLASTIFTSANEFRGIYAPIAPLIEPWRYGVIGALLAGCVVASVLAVLAPEDEKLTSPRVVRSFGASIVLGIIALLFAAAVPEADLLGYDGPAYPWTKSTLIFIAVLVALFAMTKFTKRGLCFAIPVAMVHVTAFVLLRHGAMNGLTHPMSWWFGWPIAWNLIVLVLAWLVLPNGRSVAGAAFFTLLGVSFYAYMPIVSDLRNPPMNWGYPRTWEGFKHAIQRGQYEAIGVPSFKTFRAFWDFMCNQMDHYFGDLKVQFTDALLYFALIPFLMPLLLLPKFILRILDRNGIAVGSQVRKFSATAAGFIRNPKPFWQWMGAAAVCFFMMSFLLILLANVKGDIQDGFIQKVKFISSHAMIALWIGYGLVLVCVAIVRSIGKCLKPLTISLSTLMVIVAFVYPIVQNYHDDQMVFELGGAEQNKHTFGWQFGAYQLEGAAAIRDQIAADEEPLPDPTWPEPMEPFSIFFGGTDPGRFVPTYMIYSALYRPDVYLITQNALADDTYMSVERDLYGDEIWIPSKDDSAAAFNIYVDEVQRGVRKANGDLKIENGRVQVTGALGVMEINGILTRMMFDHDRLRHSFYVEESYVIPWMYEFLSPHGLIMKINPESSRLNDTMVRRDREFWDWYLRRLLGDPTYRRDFAGQKSFSKLRTAIAGLYANKGRRSDAAQAFREACILYPVSPEAVFRYAQEMLLPYRRWDSALELMDYTDLMDPHNKRTGSLRSYLENLTTMTAEIELLAPKKNRTASETVRLASAFYSLGRLTEAGRTLHPVVNDIVNPMELKLAAQIFLDCSMPGDAESVLVRYLKTVNGKDADSWSALSRIQYRSGRKSAAVQSLRQAILSDRKLMTDRISKDKELYEIATPLLRRTR